MPHQELLVERPDRAVVIVTLNRPKARNALSSSLLQSLNETMRSLDRDDEIRAMILTGAGPSFCAGLDVKELSADRSRMLAAAARFNMQDLLTGLSKPVIAAVNGAAVTGGFEVALCCDIIIASSSAFFQDTHSRLGLLPGWGLSQRLSRQIGIARAKEISLACAPISAGEAEKWGLVNRVVSPHRLMDTAVAVARNIAQSAPEAIARQKSLIDVGYTRTLADALQYEREHAS